MSRYSTKRIGAHLVQEGLDTLCASADEAFRLLGEEEAVRALRDQYVRAKAEIEIGLRKLDLGSPPSPRYSSCRAGVQTPQGKILPGRLSEQLQVRILQKLAGAPRTGLLQKGLVKFSGAQASGVSRFLAKAEEVGLITRADTGRNALRCFITESGMRVANERDLTPHKSRQA